MQSYCLQNLFINVKLISTQETPCVESSLIVHSYYIKKNKKTRRIKQTETEIQKKLLNKIINKNQNKKLSQCHRNFKAMNIFYVTWILIKIIL